jgi:hypothetical protein
MPCKWKVLPFDITMTIRYKMRQRPHRGFSAFIAKTGKPIGTAKQVMMFVSVEFRLHYT